mmetsp:Transcript_43318/g.135664  ORF Transcript_43318/g.135664 Transcript_43318/m.135664 type:complete len:158 (+) Transcript_43318:244-717(+)
MVDTHFEGATCAVVQAEMLARIAGEQLWEDPHNGGSYKVISASMDRMEAERRTGDGKYLDKMVFHFTETFNGGCEVKGCSQSQVFSLMDFSTNFCNLHNLYCGSMDGCPIASTDLVYKERSHTTLYNWGGMNKRTCLGKSTDSLRGAAASEQAAQQA